MRKRHVSGVSFWKKKKHENSKNRLIVDFHVDACFILIIKMHIFIIY